MASERLGLALKRRCDLEYGPNGGTRRRRRRIAPVEVEGVRWLIARVAPGVEFAVADDLAAAGFRTYCPHKVRVSYRAGQRGPGKPARRERDLPVFPGYVMVGCPDGLLLGRLSHERILAVLGARDGAASERLRAAVAAVAALHAAGGFADAGPARFAVGDTVRLAAGPLASLAGRVAALPDEMRVVVSVALFGRPTPLKTNAGQLERM